MTEQACCTPALGQSQIFCPCCLSFSLCPMGKEVTPPRTHRASAASLLPAFTRSRSSPTALTRFPVFHFHLAAKAQEAAGRGRAECRRCRPPPGPALASRLCGAGRDGAKEGRRGEKVQGHAVASLTADPQALQLGTQPLNEGRSTQAGTRGRN